MNAYNTIEAINNFLSAISELDKHWEQICDNIRNNDFETQDILHELELSRFNACEGFTLAAKLREVRKRRRDNKDEKAMLLPFKQWVDNHKSLAIDLYKMLNNMKKIDAENQGRVYHPRVRNDLKICSAAGK